MTPRYGSPVFIWRQSQTFTVFTNAIQKNKTSHEVMNNQLLSNDGEKFLFTDTVNEDFCSSDVLKAPRQEPGVFAGHIHLNLTHV